MAVVAEVDEGQLRRQRRSARGVYRKVNGVAQALVYRWTAVDQGDVVPVEAQLYMYLA